VIVARFRHQALAISLPPGVVDVNLGGTVGGTLRLGGHDGQDRRASMHEREPEATIRRSSSLELPCGLTAVTEWLAWGARLDPDAPAVQDTDRCLTHQQFDALTDRVAAELFERGVRPGDRVGLCIDRSIGLVAGLVGVLKCGAVYVPLDPTYPRERLEVMQQDAALTLTLVSRRHHDWIAAAGGKVHVWEDLVDVLGDDHVVPAVDVPVDHDPERAVFIVFTSGSTGRPKGVELPHRAVANLVEWQLARRSFRPSARVLQYSSISFDVSLQEITTTLASGGHLFMVPDDERRDPRRLLQLLGQLEIERLFLPFVALRSLVEVARRGDGLPETLAEVITAGEQLRVDDALRATFAGRPGVTLDNQYGPSETHVVTAHLLDGDPLEWPDLPPIGRPIANCQVVLLDEQQRPVSDGDVGELYLGGRNLALGYFGRPELTAERFVTITADGDDRRYYRTGDLGRIDEHGDIQFHGRADHQVKIRGHRVEPGEISAVAGRMPGVAQCLSHTFHKASGAPFIVTYYVAEGDASSPDVTPSDLRKHLRANLPPYMVPAFVVRLDHIALGPSGKANLQTLPDPRHTTTGLGPDYATDTERRLAAIWTDVLEFPNLPPDVDFFDLGGDSLAAVTLFLRIADEFDAELPLATIVQAPTLRALASRIDTRSSLADNGNRSLQVLQEGAPGVPPLVLAHGGGGNVLIFSELAVNLGPDQPIYAFQWSGWDGHSGETTVAEMAGAYVRELLRVAPVGPYRLGGHCIGGLTAIEMARRLVELGAEIDGPLIVSDAPNLAARSHHAEEPQSNSESERRFEAMVDTLRSRVPEELRTDGWRGRTVTELAESDSAPAPKLDPARAVLHRFPWMLRSAKATRTWLQMARLRLLLRVGREVPMDQREMYCTETLIRAARRHCPQPWDGDMLYFRTSTFAASQMALEGWWDDVEMGFGELCMGRFESHVVGGRHNDPLKLPWVAERIRAAFGSDTSASEADAAAAR
jgi:amino acid adenylation domain-containing protein